MAGAGGFGPRGPPPPPPLGPGGIVHFDGPPMDDRHFQPRTQPQPPQRQQPAQFPRTVHVMNGSNKISDISPGPPPLTEDFCRRKLTNYEVFTLRKAEPLETKEYHEKEPRRVSKYSTTKSNKPKANWQRIHITQDTFDQADIIKRIKSLDKTTRPITTKKANLAPNQHMQVSKLVDDKIAFEMDPNFTWTLVQLERKEVINKYTGYKETESMTLYLKRAPNQRVSPIVMYQNIENAKAQAGRPQQHFNPMMGGGMQGGKMGGAAGGSGPGPKMGAGGAGGGMAKGIQVVHDGNSGIGKGGPAGANKGPKVEVFNDPRRSKSPGPGPRFSKSPIRGGNKNRYDSDSSDSSSDSDSSGSFYSDTETGTTISSRSDRRRRESSYGARKPTRQHEKGYVMLETPRRRRASGGVAYAPEPPRIGARAPSYERPSGIDPVAAEIFAAGAAAGMKVAAADKLSPPSPRRIIYDDRSPAHSSFSDELRMRDLRIRDEPFRIRDDPLRDDRSIISRGYSDPLDDYRREDLRRDELRRDSLRRDDLLHREELKMREVEDRLRRDSLPSPRTRMIPMDYLPRGGVSSLPLDEAAYSYMRNPMAPAPDLRRRDLMRERMDYRDERDFGRYRR